MHADGIRDQFVGLRFEHNDSEQCTSKTVRELQLVISSRIMENGAMLKRCRNGAMDAAVT